MQCLLQTKLIYRALMWQAGNHKTTFVITYQCCFPNTLYKRIGESLQKSYRKLAFIFFCNRNSDSHMLQQSNVSSKGRDELWHSVKHNL